MADEDTKSEVELIKQLGERMKTLVKLSSEHIKQLAERSALLARMHARGGRSIQPQRRAGREDL